MVHQTEFQQQMMSKYGRTIVGMDATYKVCKWSFPFFLLTVVTNHGHAFPVAMFFMEHESGKGIAEALSIIRSWNPEWRPAYLMVDKDAKEENAINEVRSLAFLLLLVPVTTTHIFAGAGPPWHGGAAL